MQAPNKFRSNDRFSRFFPGSDLVKLPISMFDIASPQRPLAYFFFFLNLVPSMSNGASTENKPSINMATVDLMDIPSVGLKAKLFKKSILKLFWSRFTSLKGYKNSMASFQLPVAVYTSLSFYKINLFFSLFFFFFFQISLLVYNGLMDRCHSLEGLTPSSRVSSKYNHVWYHFKEF